MRPDWRARQRGGPVSARAPAPPPGHRRSSRRRPRCRQHRPGVRGCGAGRHRWRLRPRRCPGCGRPRTPSAEARPAASPPLPRLAASHAASSSFGNQNIHGAHGGRRQGGSRREVQDDLGCAQAGARDQGGGLGRIVLPLQDQDGAWAQQGVLDLGRAGRQVGAGGDDDVVASGFVEGDGGRTRSAVVRDDHAGEGRRRLRATRRSGWPASGSRPTAPARMTPAPSRARPPRPGWRPCRQARCARRRPGWSGRGQAAPRPGRSGRD